MTTIRFHLTFFYVFDSLAAFFIISKNIFLHPVSFTYASHIFLPFPSLKVIKGNFATAHPAWLLPGKPYFITRTFPFSFWFPDPLSQLMSSLLQCSERDEGLVLFWFVWCCCCCLKHIELAEAGVGANLVGEWQAWFFFWDDCLKGSFWRWTIYVMSVDVPRQPLLCQGNIYWLICSLQTKKMIALSNSRWFSTVVVGKGEQFWCEVVQKRARNGIRACWSCRLQLFIKKTCVMKAASFPGGPWN